MGIVVDQPQPEDLSTGELIARLGDQLSTMIRDEMRLAQAELGAKAKHAGTGLGLFGASGLVAFFAMAAAITTAIAALALVLPLWLAALIVTAVLLSTAGILALSGRKNVKDAAPLKPERAMESLKRDVADVKEHARHARP